MYAAEKDNLTIDDTLVAHVERTLAEYLDSRQSTIAVRSSALGEALTALRDFVLGGGKRLRPTFAWWGWRVAGGEQDGPLAEAVLRAVSSLELIQACALVHDDVMDDSALRRGAPTMHVAFADNHRGRGWHGVPERFGVCAAILLGDIALAWADDMFHCSGVPVDRLTAASEPWRGMRSEMLAGQYLDVLTQARGDLSAKAALRVARWKTAAYTVERPLHVGAALGGADPDLVKCLRTFGADIGVAFQLRDDLLGVFGDAAVTGKPAGDDLREGKRTLLVAEGLERAQRLGRQAEAALLRDSLGRADLSEEDVTRIRGTLVDLGAVSEVETRIDRLTESAMTALTAANLTDPATSRLADLAVTATRRTH